MKSVLFVNPPIYDFSAYDFWLKPYGLLRLAGYLRDKVEICYFDFMDRYSKYLKPDQIVAEKDKFGRGGYYAQPVEKPWQYRDIKANYKRFGVPEEAFVKLLQEKIFDVVLITSAMTYWYLGIKEVIANVRRYQPKAKILLGGIYASLCYEHAKTLGADFVEKGSATEKVNLTYLEEVTDAKLDFSAIPYWEGYDRLPYGILKLNDGCPLSCSYCSVKKFYPQFAHRELERIFQEYDLLLKRGAKNISFYDDALLVDPKKNLYPFLRQAHDTFPAMRFHAPNAMHVNLISEEMAQFLAEVGFKKIFLGFESSSFRFQSETGGQAGQKTGVREFQKAISALKHAGFPASDITAYLLVGHPKQNEDEVIESVKFVASCGVRSMLAEYSPIPGTADGDACSEFVDLSEPLYHNSSVFPLFSFGREKVQRIKDLVRECNRQVLAA